MLRKRSKQLNFFSQLYHRIPEDHILKKIDSAISLEFVNKTLENSYCKDFGRPAKEPELMLRILLIQHLYNLSDERVIEEINVNLAYMYFVGINPDEELPHPSLLAKFRTMRLKDSMMDDIMTEIVRQCVEKGIISTSNGLDIDSTHILANTTKKVPERIMKQLSKKIFTAMDKTDYEIPDYKDIADHEEAKLVMKEYLESVIESANETALIEVEEAKEVLDSPKFLEQKGIRSLVDKDARVGNKSKTYSFFGYKMEYTMTPNERVITAVTVNHGAYVDGDNFDKLYQQSKNAGLDVVHVYGDKAYFKKDILDIVKADNCIPVIPVSATIYHVNEDLFQYNKDSDQWLCKQGNATVSKEKKTTNRKNVGEREYYEHVFETEKCVACSIRDECMKKSKAKAKVLQVGLNAHEYYEHNQWTKTEEFKEEYKKRAAIEWKNAEIKRFHGLDRARGFGLASITLQSKLVAIAVNLKRIVKILSSSPEQATA